MLSNLFIVIEKDIFKLAVHLVSSFLPLLSFFVCFMNIPSYVYGERLLYADGKTFKKPRRPYEKERLDAELKLVGEYGLRCKRPVCTEQDP